MENEAGIPTPNFDRINPAECVNAKLRKLHRLINSAYMAKIKPFGLGGSMLSILFIIGKKKHVNQKTLAEALVLDPSTMSRDLKKLMAKNWVRARKGEDLRNKELELTDEGRALLEEVVPVWEALHNKVTGLLGQFNVQQIDHLIHAIRFNVDDLRE